jgi:hypothetical protein
MLGVSPSRSRLLTRSHSLSSGDSTTGPRPQCWDGSLTPSQLPIYQSTSVSCLLTQVWIEACSYCTTAQLNGTWVRPPVSKWGERGADVQQFVRYKRYNDGTVDSVTSVHVQLPRVCPYANQRQQLLWCAVVWSEVSDSTSQESRTQKIQEIAWGRAVPWRQVIRFTSTDEETTIT